MSPGIQYALAAMLLFGVGDLIYKRGAAAGAPPHQFLMVQSWVFLPTVTGYALLTGSLHFVPGALWGALVGVFVLTGFYNFAHSLKSGPVSVNAPVFRLSFVITAGLAVALLGEPLTAFKLSGIALALAFCAMVESLARADASVVVPVAQMGFVVTSLVGFLFLREPFSARKDAGLLAAIAALASLAHG